MAATSLYLLTFSLLLHTINGAADPLFHFCSSSENFTTNSPYETNLKNLFSYLSFKIPPSGFAIGSTGNNHDQAYGLGLCRGDVSTTDCKTCVGEATSEIVKRCPLNKGVIIWYDNCLFKYSDKEFFGQIDNKNKFYMWNVQNVSNPDAFNKKTNELLSELAEKASVDKRLFKAGEMEVDGTKKLYGLVQCTRDLGSDVCKKCLDGIIGELPIYSDGKEGGRVVSGSCNVRYEIYPFVN